MKKAIEVMLAIQAVYRSQSTDIDYITKHSNDFLLRCGVDYNKTPYQSIKQETIEHAIFYLLDSDQENIFRHYLGA